MRFPLRTVTLLICVAATSCTGDVVAVVNREPITRMDMVGALRAALHRLDPMRLREPSSAIQIKQTVLSTIIDERLVAQAGKAHVSEQELQDYLTSYMGRYSDASFQEMLAARGLDMATWMTERRRRLLIERYVATNVAPRITIDEAAIRQYYQTHRETFQQPDAVRVRQILLDREAIAGQVRKKLEAGENFARLAMEYSISPESAQGGELGWIERGTFPPVFEETCFTLPVGAISKIVRSEFGFHLFKILERRRPSVVSLDTARETIRAQLRQEAISDTYSLAIAALRARAHIDIHEDALARVPMPQPTDDQSH